MPRADAQPFSLSLVETSFRRFAGTHRFFGSLSKFGNFLVFLVVLLCQILYQNFPGENFLTEKCCAWNSISYHQEQGYHNQNEAEEKEDGGGSFASWKILHLGAIPPITRCFSMVDLFFCLCEG